MKELSLEKALGYGYEFRYREKLRVGDTIVMRKLGGWDDCWPHLFRFASVTLQNLEEVSQASQ